MSSSGHPHRIEIPGGECHTRLLDTNFRNSFKQGAKRMLRKIAFKRSYGYKNEEGAGAPGIYHRMRTPVTRFAGYAALLATAGLTLSYFTQVKAESEESQSKTGLKIAPVPLNLQGKNVELVGYGSYLVNAVSGCNICHTAGAQNEYAPGGNPDFGQKPAVINPAVYLGGGWDFGPLIAGTANIVSRNLTPDKTGLPVGGRTYDEFRTIMTTGVDLDKAHPACVGGPNPGCLLAPFDGTVLHVMPWPTFSNMKEREIRAIYEYLKAIPCVSGPPAPSILHNDCK
jgi:hypothetical protein